MWMCEYICLSESQVLGTEQVNTTMYMTILNTHIHTYVHLLLLVVVVVVVLGFAFCFVDCARNKLERELTDWLS